MIGWVDNYCVKFEDSDFIEIDKDLKYSEKEFGIQCFVEDTKEYRIFCKHPKTGKAGWATVIRDIQKGD